MRILWLIFWALVTIALIAAAMSFHAVLGALVILWVVWIFDLARRNTKLAWADDPRVHRCWNCFKPIPLSAARCQYCGVAQ